MEDLEIASIGKLDFNVHVFYRYVDDIFMIIPESKVDLTLASFNSYHPRLKFTCEIEKDNTLNFLNTSVIRADNGSLLTNWYRKPTFSGRYINFLSCHPYQYKLNTIINLVDHAILLSHEMFHAGNLSTIKLILKNNCYPDNIVDKVVSKRYKFLKSNKLKRTNDRSTENCDLFNNVMLLPYFHNISEDIKRSLRNLVDVRFTIPKNSTQL